MYNTDMPTRAELPSSARLLRSTLIAVTTAVALLVTVVLPAEYAVDPTGIGGILGLTQMGEIKQQLADEATADLVVEAPEQELAAQLGEIVPDSATQVTSPDDSDSALASVTDAENTAWRDEVSLTLAPGESAEIKLVMKKDDTASYEWTVDQGNLNSDLHTDGTDGNTVSYRQGRAETSDTGELTAVFDGAHGWYWRNRSDLSVTVTLRARGAYSEVKRML